MVTTTTTLIDTLSILSDLGVIVALKLTGLVLQMFCTSIFLGHSLNLCSMFKTNYTGITNKYFLDVIGWVFIHATSFCRLNRNSWHNWYFFFHVMTSFH